MFECDCLHNLIFRFESTSAGSRMNCQHTCPPTHQRKIIGNQMKQLSTAIIIYRSKKCFAGEKKTKNLQMVGTIGSVYTLWHKSRSQHEKNHVGEYNKLFMCVIFDVYHIPLLRRRWQ